MDRKAIIVLVLSFVLLIFWYPLTSKLFPPVPLPATNTVAGATNRIPGATNAEAQKPDTAVISAARSHVDPTPPKPDAPEETITVENAVARYIFTSHGGGLKLVELKNHRATIDCKDRSSATNRTPATLNTRAPVPALSMLGGEGLHGNGAFNLKRTADGVRAEKVLTNGIAVIKDFHLGTNYVLTATVRIENRSGDAVRLPAQEWVVGTATPIGQRDETLYMGLQWYDGRKAHFINESWFANYSMGCSCLPASPRSLYEVDANLSWAAVHNQFFTMVAVPKEPATKLIGRRVNLPPPTSQQLAADPKAFAKPFGYETAFVFPMTNLPPSQAIERSFTVYAGPKEYNTLARLGNNLDVVMNFGFFGIFSKGLLLAMNGLHRMGLGYGLAIIVITVIIKSLFWPLTLASTRSMKRMALLQPQMKALQEKYKDDPKKMNQKLMEFMKEHKVNPMGGCIPILLQIPVFFGFYTMLQYAIELRGAEFLWACDLSQADTVATIAGFPINPLPLMMGATMLWQARMTPVSPGMDPMQQKIMKYMPLMFMVFLYNFSAGLTLYWTVQNLISILQMKVTKANDPVQMAQSQKTAAPSPRPPAPPWKRKK